MRDILLINQVIRGNFLDYLDELIRLEPDKKLVITDPPYNIGFNYTSFKDNRKDDEYIKELRSLNLLGGVVLIQYPEESFRYVAPALGVPDAVSAWCYNSNVPRRFRLISYFGVKPDYSKIKQPYKNIKDKRILKLMKEGRTGTGLYEWWDDIQQVKNVCHEKTEHPCQVPVELIKRIILLTSAPNDLIVDPYMGSGTTAIACLETGRDFIGFEMVEEYCEIARNRIANWQAKRVLPVLEDID